MRRPRLKVKGEGFYHVVSRIGGKRFLIDDREKGILLGMIRAAAGFSGVDVYTYALMDNHFHLLVRVPERVEVPDGELIRRIRLLYGPERSAKLFEQWEKWERAGNGKRVEDAKTRLRSRMYDLSQFVKTFKETYTQDYNRRHDNTGTIWEGRFKSILVEGSYRALMTVGGYIHLNPVRAEVVEEPEQAQNTGYGAACDGDAVAKRGIETLVSRAFGNETTSWSAARDACREVMDGAIAKDADAPPEAETQTEDSWPFHDLLRHRHTSFLHGGALGHKGFLRDIDGLLPPRLRRRSEGILDHCTGLGLTSALGVREAS